MKLQIEQKVFKTTMQVKPKWGISKWQFKFLNALSYDIILYILL